MSSEVRYPTPGEILRAEFMDPLGLTTVQLADCIGVPVRDIAKILDGTAAVDKEVGGRLALHFGMSEAFWTGLRADYYRAQHHKCRIDPGIAATP